MPLHLRLHPTAAGSPSFVHAQDPNAQSALSAFQQAATQVSLSRTPLFALMLAYELQSGGSDAGAGGGASAAPQLPFDAACFAGDSRMAWLARDSSKPVRGCSANKINYGAQCIAAETEGFRMLL